MTQRPSVLGPDETWRDPGRRSVLGPDDPRRDPRRRSVLGPEDSWRAPRQPRRRWTRARVVRTAAAATALAAVVAALGAAEDYAPLVPGSTFGLDGEIRHVEDGDGDHHLHGGFADAALPYRDGEQRSWTYSLRNRGRFSVEVLGIGVFESRLAELVGVTWTHDGVTGEPRPVTLGPGESLRVEMTYRSVRCELVGPDEAGSYHSLTGVAVTQRALRFTRTRYVDLPQDLRVGIDNPGSLPCPRDRVVPAGPGAHEPREEPAFVVPIAPPY